MFNQKTLWINCNTKCRRSSEHDLPSNLSFTSLQILLIVLPPQIFFSIKWLTYYPCKHTTWIPRCVCRVSDAYEFLHTVQHKFITITWHLYCWYLNNFLSLFFSDSRNYSRACFRIWHIIKALLDCQSSQWISLLEAGAKSEV